MPTTDTTRQTIPTPREARRAIYLDFEGTEVDPPSLLGAACDSDWHAVVIERALHPLAGHGADRLAVSTGGLSVSLRELRHRAERENRRLFAWSSHELDVISSVVTTDADRQWWAEHLENALPPARRWAHSHQVVLPRVQLPKGHRRTRNHLGRYLAAIGYAVPSGAGPGYTASRIRTLRGQLARRKSYKALTPVAKAKWTKLCAHNRHDCLGLASLVQRLADDAAR
ncbi:hypothetical protein [Gemmatimonas sp.]|uniref:hypothetical protein n=1 Tax=Gemmatimonas sp. TaxID=1962908 RepID=UPI0035637802